MVILVYFVTVVLPTLGLVIPYSTVTLVDHIVAVIGLACMGGNQVIDPQILAIAGGGGLADELVQLVILIVYTLALDSFK